jgi:hypothetical protein
VSLIDIGRQSELQCTRVIPATETPTPTDTPVPTATDTPVPTATNTPVPTETDTPQPTATNTPVPTATDTPVPTATNTPVPTATDTPVPTATNTPPPGSTATHTPTRTNTPQPGATATNTPTRTPTPTPTITPPPGSTATNTPTRTNTPQAGATATNTPTRTPTANGTPTCTNTSLGVCTAFLPNLVRLNGGTFSGPNEREPNDTEQQGNGPLQSGTSYQGRPDDTKDYWYVDVPAGATLTIEVSNHTGGNLQMQVYQTFANLVIFAPDPGPTFTRSATNLPAGRYYIYFNVGSGWNSTPYTLRVSYP